MLRLKPTFFFGMPVSNDQSADLIFPGEGIIIGINSVPLEKQATWLELWAVKDETDTKFGWLWRWGPSLSKPDPSGWPSDVNLSALEITNPDERLNHAKETGLLGWWAKSSGDSQPPKFDLSARGFLTFHQYAAAWRDFNQPVGVTLNWPEEPQPDLSLALFHDSTITTVWIDKDLAFSGKAKDGKYPPCSCLRQVSDGRLAVLLCAPTVLAPSKYEDHFPFFLRYQLTDENPIFARPENKDAIPLSGLHADLDVDPAHSDTGKFRFPKDYSNARRHFGSTHLKLLNTDEPDFSDVWQAKAQSEFYSLADVTQYLLSTRYIDPASKKFLDQQTEEPNFLFHHVHVRFMDQGAGQAAIELKIGISFQDLPHAVASPEEEPAYIVGTRKDQWGANSSPRLGLRLPHGGAAPIGQNGQDWAWVVVPLPKGEAPSASKLDEMELETRVVVAFYAVQDFLNKAISHSFAMLGTSVRSGTECLEGSCPVTFAPNEASVNSKRDEPFRIPLPPLTVVVPRLLERSGEKKIQATDDRARYYLTMRREQLDDHLDETPETRGHEAQGIDKSVTLKLDGYIQGFQIRAELAHRDPVVREVEFGEPCDQIGSSGSVHHIAFALRGVLEKNGPGKSGLVTAILDGARLTHPYNPSVLPPGYEDEKDFGHLAFALKDTKAFGQGGMFEEPAAGIDLKLRIPVVDTEIVSPEQTSLYDPRMFSLLEVSGDPARIARRLEFEKMVFLLGSHSERDVTVRPGPDRIREPVPGTAGTRAAGDPETWIDRFLAGSAGRPSRTETLLVPLTERHPPDVGMAESPFEIAVTERVDVGIDRRLTISLRRFPAGALGKRANYIVLGQLPFIVTRFSTQDIAERADSLSNEIGIWTLDQRMWLLRSSERTFGYELAPQVVGEDMSKPGRREITDLRKDFGDMEKTERVAELATALVNMRFSPNARLWVEASDTGQAYLPPPWALADLFGRRAGVGSGVRLRSMCAEFLYGLSVFVDTSLSSTFDRFARIASLEVLTGSMRGFLVPAQDVGFEESDPDFRMAYGQRWSAIHRTVASRPAFWQTFAGELSNPATFAESTKFMMRKSALLTPPLDDVDIPAKAPRDGPDLPYNYKNKQYSPQVIVRFHPQGIGGFLWGFESANIAKQTIEEGPVGLGKLEAPAVSPIGGWAAQTANYQEGRVRFLSWTEQGHVSRYQVEVMGRIAVFKHRSKHVVIYERHVAPSLQFADENVPTSRRPIIRKVEEYIEILQPERRYPEDSKIDPRAAAPLCGVRFERTRIHVDSRWGEDLGTHGWRVPLWNRAEAIKKPQIYARPEISFLITSEGADEDQIISQTCLEPDKLFFFVDRETRKDPKDPSTGPENPLEPETDKWPARPGIDFPALAHPFELEPHQVSTPDEPQAPVTRFAPGYGRFSWRLAPPTRGANLTKERQSEPIFAALDALTISRGWSKDLVAKAGKGGIEAASRALESLPPPTKISGTLAQWRKLPLELGDQGQVRLSDEDKVAAGKWLGEVGSRLDGMLPFLTNKLPNCDDLLSQVEHEVSRAFEEIKGVTQRALDAIKKRTLGDLKVLGDGQKREKQEIEDYLSKTIKMLFPGVMLPGEPMNQPMNPRLMRPNLTPIRQVIGKVDDAAADVSAIIDTIQADLAENLRLARARLDQILDAFDPKKPWSPNRRQSLENELRKAYTRLRINLLGLVDDALAAIAEHDNQAVGKLMKEARRILVAVAEAAADCLCSTIADQIASWKPDPPKKWEDAYHAIRIGLDQGLAQAQKILPDELAKVKLLALNISSDLQDLDRILDQMDKIDVILEQIRDQLIIKPILRKVDDAFAAADAINRLTAELTDSFFKQLQKDAEAWIEDKEKDLLKQQNKDKFLAVCKQLVAEISDLTTYSEDIKILAGKAESWIGEAQGTIDAIRNIKRFDKRAEEDIKRLLGDLASSEQMLRGYAHSVAAEAQRLGEHGVEGTPNDVLRLMRAAGDVPKLPMLDFNADRLAYYFEETKDVISTTPAGALLNTLGDELRAIGIKLPFEGLSDHLEPSDLITDLDVNKLIPNCGGLNLGKLLPDLKMPKELKDAIKITHAFDRKQYRAWVQVDVDLPLGEKASLFDFEIFAATLVKPRLKAQIRLEASADTDQVQKTVYAEVAGDWEMSVAGEIMVALRRTKLKYREPEGLDFAMPPDGIEFNKLLKFVTDVLQTFMAEVSNDLVPIKQDDQIVGVAHVFTSPPIDVFYGTSGIANLQLSNTFALRAQPDFMLVEQFSLSSPEAPFFFTVWILSGTGWLSFAVEYRPFEQDSNRQLVLVVDFAIGAGAMVGFGFPGVRGIVYFSFDLCVQYRKSLGGPGGDLKLSLVLVVAGTVDVLGIVTANISVVLSLAYKEGGQMTATGRLTLKIKVSRILTVSVNTRVNYELEGGQAKKTASTDTKVAVDTKEVTALASGS